jgi:AcrR family transcriptional regulator
MKIKEKKRTYQMSERARQVALNDRKVINAMSDLWLEMPLSEITLDQVSQKAGVTVRTILRKFGSKEGLFTACIESEGDRFTHKRLDVKPGDLTGIIDALLDEYEHMGNALVRTLTAEYDYPVIQTLLDKARLFHREWCLRVFDPFLPDPGSDNFENVLLAFITATEFYLWKLLRKDLGKTREQCRQIFLFSLQSLAMNAKNQLKVNI